MNRRRQLEWHPCTQVETAQQIARRVWYGRAYYGPAFPDFRFEARHADVNRRFVRVDSILLSFRLTPAKEQERQCCLLEGPAGRHSSAIGAPILPIQASSCGAGDPSLEVHKLLRLTCKTAPNQQAEASHLVTVGTTLMEMQFMSRTLIRTAALNKSYYTHSRPLRSWFVQARLLFKHV